MEKITYKDLSPFLKMCALGGFVAFINLTAVLILFALGIIFGLIGY